MKIEYDEERKTALTRPEESISTAAIDRADGTIGMTMSMEGVEMVTCRCQAEVISKRNTTISGADNHRIF